MSNLSSSFESAVRRARAAGRNELETVEQVLRLESQRLVRVVDWIRLGGSMLWLGLILLGWRAGLEAWRSQLLPVLGYWVGSTIVLVASYVGPSAYRFTRWAPVFLDLPCQFAAMAIATIAAGSTAAISDGLFLGLLNLTVLCAVLSLDLRIIVPTTVLACAASVTLHAMAGWSVFVMVASSGMLCVAAVLTSTLMRRLTRHASQSTAERIQRWRLGRYFSPAVVSAIADGKLGEPEYREVSVLFMDIRGFTSMIEHMDPREAIQLLNRHHTAMVAEVFKRGGTLDKFTGDGLMAYFGAPIAQSDHAELAVGCGLAMLEALEQMNRKRGSTEPALRIGIGIATGRVVVGDVGTPERADYTVIGDAVNTAARLENLTKALGAEILVSWATREQAGERYDWIELDPVNVKGKAMPLRPYVPTKKGSGEITGVWKFTARRLSSS